jgi:hypothetical protein
MKRAFHLVWVFLALLGRIGFEDIKNEQTFSYNIQDRGKKQNEI